MRTPGYLKGVANGTHNRCRTRKKARQQKKKTHINLEVQDLLRVTNHLHIWCMRWSGKFWCNKILNWNSSKMLTVQNQRNSVKLTISNFYRFKNVHCFFKKKTRPLVLSSSWCWSIWVPSIFQEVPVLMFSSDYAIELIKL